GAASPPRCRGEWLCAAARRGRGGPKARCSAGSTADPRPPLRTSSPRSAKALNFASVLRLVPQALSHDSSPLQALRRPDGGEVMAFRHGLGARRERNPGLLRRPAYVDVWGASIRIIGRAHPAEADSGPGLRVVAPDSNLAGGAARDLLASSACRWRIDDLWLARGMHDSIRLVEGVERVGCTGLALAPATVAGVDNERRADQSIPDLAASASALHGVLRPMVARTRGSCHSVRPEETNLLGPLAAARSGLLPYRSIVRAENQILQYW